MHEELAGNGVEVVHYGVRVWRKQRLHKELLCFALNERGATDNRHLKEWRPMVALSNLLANGMLG
jgi:hypothetical protein